MSVQDAIDTYWVMNILLSKTKYEKIDIDPALLERKKILKELQTNLSNARKDYIDNIEQGKNK